MPTTDDLRSAVADLSTLAAADLRPVWQAVDTPADAQVALMDVLPPLVSTYSIAAAAYAADWYDELRAEQNIDGRFFAITAEFDDQGAIELARWGVGPLFKPEPDWSAAQVLVAGGLQRRIANASRETVRRSSLSDPKARGWEWVGSGKNCDYCDAQIAKGVRTGRTTFHSHDHCNCHAAPVWDGSRFEQQQNWTDWADSPIGQIIAGIA